MAGNANSGSQKGRIFRDAIVMQLKIRDAGEDMKTLRNIADSLIDAAIEKKMDAISAIADRLDGKPAQQVDIGNVEGEEFKVKATIERIIIDPANPDSAGVSTASATKPL
jgi:hypothetical protein